MKAFNSSGPSVNEPSVLHIFCDGSSGILKDKNGVATQQTGVGVYFEEKDIRIGENCSRALGERQTNIRAELFAIVVALQELLFEPELYGYEKNKKIIIHTDSLYSIMTITTWAPKWEKNDWILPSTKKKAKNINLIKDILKLLRSPEFKDNTILFEHVKGHAKEPINYGSRLWHNWNGNRIADQLANRARIGFYA